MLKVSRSNRSKLDFIAVILPRLITSLHASFSLSLCVCVCVCVQVPCTCTPVQDPVQRTGTVFCTHALTRSYKQIDTITHNTDKSRAIHQHAQTCFPWHLWILSRVVLVGMLPNSCNGARSNVHAQFLINFSITRTLPNEI